MKVLSNDQEARVRFAYRVYSTGNTHNAPASTVRLALDLSDKVVEACGQVRTIDSVLFAATAVQVINKLEN
jgi:hypothetical protein